MKQTLRPISLLLTLLLTGVAMSACAIEYGGEETETGQLQAALMRCQFEPGCGPCAKPGDVNGDDRQDLTDVQLILQYLTLGNVQINESAGDFDGSGTVDQTDAIALMRWAFLGEGEPASNGCEDGEARRGDLNADGLVDRFDVESLDLFLVGAMASSAFALNRADFDGSGTVDQLDLDRLDDFVTTANPECGAQLCVAEDKCDKDSPIYCNSPGAMCGRDGKRGVCLSNHCCDLI